MGFPATATFSTVIDEVIMALSGLGMSDEQATSLNGGIGSGDLTFQVRDTNVVARGIAEIEDELVWVSSVNASTVTLSPWGRGYRGTTAASHSDGAIVNYKPTWPRASVARAVNDAINGVYPTIYAVSNTEFTPTATHWQYVLPSDVERVLAVEQRITAVDQWVRIRSWDVNHKANTTDFATGVSLRLALAAPTGTVRVWYAARPQALVNASDAFTVTGLPASTRDVIVYGAASRMIPWLDIGRLPVQSVEADALAQPRPLGTAIQGAREIRALYQSRLAEEQRALEFQFPMQTHRIG